MKHLITILITIFLANSIFGQVAGNRNYQNRERHPDNNINVRFPTNADLVVSVKGLANVKADSNVAIFSVTQVGKTTEEVNRLIDKRINKALEKIRKKGDVETYVDMISFVPVYEHEVDKKIFNEDTYNEVPAGFELKKNIHIKYSNPDLLNKMISIFAKAEIYDLVKVDYFLNDIEAIKKKLRNKAKTILQEKLKNYQSMLSTKSDSFEKQVVDGYKVKYPSEMYKSYQAYNSTSLNLKKSANINQSDKSKTLYYQPIVVKEFDFVLNPTVMEPVIQVMYQLKLKMNKEKDQTQSPDKEYILITPNGNFKNLNLR